MPLAPLFSGSFYARLNECLARSVGRYDVVTYVDANFLQLFLWERGGALSPILVEFKRAKLEKIIVNVVEKEKTSHLKPRGLRWSGVTWSEEPRKPLSKIINIEKNYNFRPYTYTLRGTTSNLFYSAEWRHLIGASSEQIDWRLFPIGCDCIDVLPLKLESGETMVKYSPQ